jgi:hypothetical protein
MATAKKAARKGAATKSTNKGNPADSAPKPVAADPTHPEVHPERHLGGTQEMPTAGGFSSPTQAGADREPLAGALHGKVNPNPGIGTTHDERTNSPAINRPGDREDEDDEHVYSYEQAIALPVVDKGTPVKMPSDAQLEAKRKKDSKAQSDAAKRRNDQRADGTPAEDEDVQLPLRRPIVSFKDADRRTMLVVRGKDGLGAMPSKAFADVQPANPVNA